MLVDNQHILIIGKDISSMDGQILLGRWDQLSVVLEFAEENRMHEGTRERMESPVVSHLSFHNLITLTMN